MRLFHVFVFLGGRRRVICRSDDGEALPLRAAVDPWYWRPQCSLADAAICAECARKLERAARSAIRLRKWVVANAS